MARVTIEECLDKVDNMFELILVAAKRAKILEEGEISEAERSGKEEKKALVALREIEEGLVKARNIKEYEEMLKDKDSEEEKELPSIKRIE